MSTSSLSKNNQQKSLNNSSHELINGKFSGNDFQMPSIKTQKMTFHSSRNSLIQKSNTEFSKLKNENNKLCLDDS
jgi:hypothetical protein